MNSQIKNNIFKFLKMWKEITIEGLLFILVVLIPIFILGTAINVTVFYITTPWDYEIVNYILKVLSLIYIYLSTTFFIALAKYCYENL